MKEQKTAICLRIVVILAVIVLQACGDKADNSVYTISADVSEVRFSNEYLQESTDSIAINVTFDGEGLAVGFPPEMTPVPWLTYRAENVTANSATVYIEVINAERLLPKLHSSQLRLTTTNNDASKYSSVDIDVAFLVWKLATNKEQLNFSATFGDTRAEAQSLDIISEDNQWTARSDVDWLSLDTSSGTGNGVIVATADISGFNGEGLQKANIIITELTSGDSKSIPVELALDKVYFYANTPTVAFTATQHIRALDARLTISNNGVAKPSWQASTQAQWLTLTAIDNSHLVITADANLAPLDTTSFASITISATDGSRTVDETIKVYFYNANLAVENALIEPLSVASGSLVVSPSLPKFYLAKENALYTYHQYTNSLETSLIVSPEGTSLEQLIIHPSGEYVLAKAIETVSDSDQTTSKITHRYRINLMDNTVTKIGLSDTTIIGEPLAIVRLSGRYFVVSNQLEFANEELESLFQEKTPYFAAKVDIATQANSLFALDYNSASLKRYTAQINDFGTERILMTLSHEYQPETLTSKDLISDFIVTNDEKAIYLRSQTSEWLSFDGIDFIDQGLLEANADIVTLHLVKNGHGQGSYLRFNKNDQLGFYLESYNPQQTVTSTTYTEGKQPGGILVSADQQRLIINANVAPTPTNRPRIELVTLSSE